MAQIIVRKLEDEVLEGIRTRAKANGRSTEAEVREILRQAVVPMQHRRKPLSSFIGAGGSNLSQDEINSYVRKLRDEWEH